MQTPTRKPTPTPEATMMLKPTLWRTCRVLANRTRLRLLQDLLRQPGQRVTELALCLGLQPSVVSRYLRELNARGLLEARRTGRFVAYHPVPDSSVPQAGPLLAALRRTMARQGNPVDYIFRQVTALTHPRRVVILAVLNRKSSRLWELRRTTGISEPALLRHLAKLKSRGFIRHEASRYALQPHLPPLAEALLRMVDGE